MSNKKFQYDVVYYTTAAMIFTLILIIILS